MKLRTALSVFSGDNKPPYALGVALSGGGARGLAHAGALQAIEDAGLKPDIIAGVSAGSVVAVLYAAGVKPRRILDMFMVARARDLAELSWGNGGLLKIDKFTSYITHALGHYKRLEDLRIPTYIGVTNFEEGCPAEFHEGEIGPIVTASCSIPVAIPPVTIDGVKYVDGGVLRNLPAWTIRDKCKQLIGINVSPVIKAAQISSSLIEIALRTYTLMAKANQLNDMRMCDLAVSTDEISDHNVFSLKDLTRLYNIGYANTKQALLEQGWWTPKK